jgi:rRNA maturation RNase YbeY
MKMRSAPLKKEMVLLVKRVLGKMGEPYAEVGLVLTGDAEIRRLNRRYRGIDRSTDVLAFPMREKREPGGQWPVASNKNKITGIWSALGGLDTGHNLLGDVVISVPTARRQAMEHGHPLEQEITVLMIHGLLHLMGYDHERSRAASRTMKRKERELFRAVYK